MNRLIVTTLAAFSFATGAYAQGNISGPLATPSGQLQFDQVNHDFTATLDQHAFDRFNANALAHFDDIDNKGNTVTRMLVQTGAGPVLYDFRRRPPLVQRSNRRMTVNRVFWQDDEVVLQGSQGWFRFKHGEFAKLQSSKTTYH